MKFIIISVIIVFLIFINLQFYLKIQSKDTLLQKNQLVDIQIIVQYPESKLDKKDQLYIKGEGNCKDQDLKNAILLTKNQKKQDNWYVVLKQCQNEESLKFKVFINIDQPQLGAEYLINLQDINDNKENNYIVYPFFKQVEGTFLKINDIYSSFFQNYRDMIIYLPPGYEENQYTYIENVLLMTDGQYLFTPQEFNNDNTFKQNLQQAFDPWEMETTLNEKIVDGSMEQVIVCGIFNTDDRTDEYTYIPDPKMQGGFAREYLDFIQDKIMPQIENLLRVNNNKKYGLMGASLGGLLSCFAGISRGDIYNKVGGISSSFWWDNQNFYYDFLPDNQNQIVQDLMVYIDQGTFEGQKNLQNFLRVENYFENLPQFQQGVNFFSYVDEGGYHSDFSWKQRISQPLGDLYQIQPLKPII